MKSKINLLINIPSIFKTVVIFSLLALLNGCGTKTMVVLLPGIDGKVGKVSVSAQDTSQVLEQAYQSASVARPGKGVGETKILDPDEVEALFGDALKIQPMPPMIFLLYFQAGKTDLTRSSQIVFLENLPKIKQRQTTDISIIGHTDRVGGELANMRLSLKRAAYIKALLVSEGVDSTMIEISSHGEHNPLFPTEDEVAEPRNCRVEVVVR